MINSFIRAITACSLLMLWSPAVQAAPVEVDEKLPAYTKVGGIAGNLDSIGSDTLNNLMTLWAEGFQKQYPNVRVQIEGKGSSTAPPALISGTAQLGPMSRSMKPTERDEFEKRFGYEPTEVFVAVDALAVYVNKDNPIEKLTLPQVDAIFSSNMACGASTGITTWGEAGDEAAAWKSQPISLYGRNSASGTYGFFKKVALCKGDYRNTVKEQPGSASVVQGIAEDIYAVGYSGIGYRTSGVKALKIAKKEGSPYGSVEPGDVLSGKYPLARYLVVYVNKTPGKPLDPLTAQFLNYVLSKEGQEIVVKDGYLPLSAAVSAKQTRQLQ